MALSDFKSFHECDAEFRNSKRKVKPAPVLAAGAPVADTHCHLGMLKDVPLALARAAFHGVNFIQCITDPSEKASDEVWSEDLYKNIEPWRKEAGEILTSWDSQIQAPHIRMACGVHPHNAKDWADGESILMRLLEHPLTSCIGEIGLDYHYDMSPRNVQREVFAKQLRLAHRTGLPVALHIREAHSDAIEILKREGVPQAGCILHCFNLGPEDVEPFVELGCYVALGGPLTFKKEYETRASVMSVPVDKLLTETDAPFMAPEPLRGVVCEPAQTVYTLRTLLDCLGYSGEERAIELMSPREIDLKNGAAKINLSNVDFQKVQQGLDELGMAERLYANAVRLLDRQNPVCKEV